MRILGNKILDGLEKAYDVCFIIIWIYGYQTDKILILEATPTHQELSMLIEHFT